MLKFLVALSLCAIPLVVSFHLNPIEDAHWDEEPLEFDERLSKNTSVSLNQFEVYQEVGNGALGKVFVAKKLGGSDNGTVYALKAIKMTNHSLEYVEELNMELQIMIALRDLPYSIRIHYAFQQGEWLFLVMDLSPGGDLLGKIKTNCTPEPAIGRRILTELVAGLESVQKSHVLHGDFSPKNVLIDNEGHLKLIDYGFSRWLPDDDVDYTREGWGSLSQRFEGVFGLQIEEPHLVDVINLLTNMTLLQVPELKNLTYFRGIDWQQVAERKSVAPFDPYETELHLMGPRNKTKLFNSEMDANTAAIIAYNFHNYTFVAWEHQD